MDRVLSQLLLEMDGVSPLKKVTVLAATNRPDILDQALLRAGRIDRILYVGLPDVDARKEIFKLSLSKVPLQNDVDIDLLAKQTDGFTGAEIVNICKEASLAALEENINADKLRLVHLQTIIQKTKPRTTKQLLQFYYDFQRRGSCLSL
jgi:AAA family ATPase